MKKSIEDKVILLGFLKTTKLGFPTIEELKCGCKIHYSRKNIENQVHSFYHFNALEQMLYCYEIVMEMNDSDLVQNALESVGNAALVYSACVKTLSDEIRFWKIFEFRSLITISEMGNLTQMTLKDSLVLGDLNATDEAMKEELEKNTKLPPYSELANQTQSTIELITKAIWNLKRFARILQTMAQKANVQIDAKPIEFVRLLLKPRTLLVENITMVTTTSEIKPGKMISDFVVGPGATRKVKFFRSSQTTKKTEEKTSMVESANTTNTNSYTNALKNTSSVQNKESKEMEEYARAEEQFEVDASLEVDVAPPVSPVSASVSVDTNYSTSNEQETTANTAKSTDKYAESVNEAISANTSEVNKKTEMSVQTTTSLEEIELAQSTIEEEFPNPNQTKAVRYRVWQAVQIYKVQLLLTGVSLKVTNGMKVEQIGINDLKRFSSWFKDFDIEGFEGFIRKMYENRVTIDNNMLITWPITDEGDKGAIISEFYQAVNLDGALMNTMELCENTVADEIALHQFEENVNLTRLKNTKLHIENERNLLKNEIFKKVMENDFEGIPTKELWNILIALDNEGMDSIDKHVLMQVLGSNGMNLNPLIFPKKASEKRAK